MVYEHVNSKGKTYYLNSKEVPLRNSDKTVTIYFFSGDKRDDTGCEMPADRVVAENERTGLPILKKKA